MKRKPYWGFDEKTLELFIRDILAWSFGTVRKKDEFQQWLTTTDEDFQPRDELLIGFAEWFYRQWDAYGDCCGEVVDSALDEGKLQPLWKDRDTVSEHIPEQVYRKGYGITNGMHVVINDYMEHNGVAFEWKEYFRLLERLEARLGPSPISTSLWDDSSD